ncbi:hypothetical protein B0H10DRAFT_2243065 [Mycena sp. CBHHK59/15]|nr:hypothetical protein B0H10DRAFT_2243065 [Mycena sp. CBHHK59/15]
MSRKLTPAQKSAATRAAKIEKQRQEDIAFITANIGPHQAKQTAQKNATTWGIWNESSTSHKRTSSTAQASEITKKARETAPVPEHDHEDDEPEEPEVPVKSTSRKHAPPPINIDSDSEPEAEQVQPIRIDFNNLPSAKSKSKSKSKTKPKAVAKGKAVVNVTAKAVKTKVAAPTRKQTKMVAESASESKEASPSGDADSGNTDNSDEDEDQDNDAAPNAQEFADEVPQVVRTRAHATAANAEESDKSRELDDVAPRSKTVKPAEELFESEDDEAASGTGPTGSICDHARGLAVPVNNDDSDVMMDEAIADGLVSVPLRTHSRRASTGSGWSSGRDLTIPNSESDSDAASEPEPPPPRIRLYHLKE